MAKVDELLVLYQNITYELSFSMSSFSHCNHELKRCLLKIHLK